MCKFVTLYDLWVAVPEFKDERSVIVCTAAFGLLAMGETDPFGGGLSCLCQVCLTWRRLGQELARGHPDKGYQQEALVRLRHIYNELLDYREANLIGLGSPLAGGLSRPVPPPPPESGSAGVEKSPQDRTLSEEESEESSSQEAAKTPDKRGERKSPANEGKKPVEKVAKQREEKNREAKESRRERVPKEREGVAAGSA